MRTTRLSVSMWMGNLANRTLAEQPGHRPPVGAEGQALPPPRILRARNNEVSSMSQVSQNPAPSADDFTPGRPVVFRNATVLTIDPSLGMITGGDVLVVDKRIAAVGKQLAVPDGTVEIDASGGIL